MDLWDFVSITHMSMIVAVVDGEDKVCRVKHLLMIQATCRTQNEELLNAEANLDNDNICRSVVK